MEKYNFLNEDILKNPAEFFSGANDFEKFFIASQKDCLRTFIENFNNKKIFIFRGGENFGKSSLKPFVRKVFNEDISIFEYICEKITSLDDIFISLNQFIDNARLKTDSDLKNKTSIDEKIITFFKKNTHNIILMFDNFEYLLNDEGEIEDENIKSFLQLINSLETIKLIFLTRVCSKNILKSDENEEITLRVFPVEEEDLALYFKRNEIPFPSYLMRDFIEQIKGRTFLLNFAFKASKILNLPLTELFKENQTLKSDFQEFLLKKLYTVLPNEAKKILFYISIFRCTINNSILKAIDNFPNIEESINALRVSLFLEDIDNLQTRKCVNIFINKILSEKEKNTLHGKISQFYSEQIPLPPSDRLLKLSRTTMYNEKFFHQNAIKKQPKNFISNFLSSNGEEQTNADRIKYMASISQYMPVLNVEKKEQDKKQEEETKSPKKNFDIDIELPSNISLTDEEKLLLSQDDNEDLIEETSDIVSSVDINLPVEQEENKKEEPENEEPELAQPKEPDENEKAMNLYYKGMELLNNNESQTCIGYFRSALGLIDKSDIDNFNRVILALAKALSDNFKFDEAKEYLERIVNSDLNLQAELKVDAFIELATIEDYEGKLDEAISLFDKALKIAQENSLINVISNIYFKKALSFDDNNDLINAEENYTKAIENATESNEENFLASAYSNLASIKKDKREFKEAVELYKKALLIDEKYKNYDGQTHDYTNLANLFEENKKYNLAVKTYIMATKTAKKTEDSYLIASCYLELGDCFFGQKDYKNSLKAYILSKKNIDGTISTDSKNKIERRFKNIYDEVGEAAYNYLLKELNLS